MTFNPDNPPAMVNLYLVAFIGWGKVDWMATIYRREDMVLQLDYRFRYYDPNSHDMWDGTDEKSWYHLAASPGTPVKELVDLVLKMQMLMATVSPHGKPLVVDGVYQRDGDVTSAYEKLEQKSWCAMKRFKTKEEAEAFMKSKGAN